MAITYLSGERIQGASNAEGTPVVITGWTTNGATDVAGLLTKTASSNSWTNCCNNTDSVENYSVGTAYKFKYSNLIATTPENVRVGIAQTAISDNSGIVHGFAVTDEAYELDGTTLTRIDASPSSTDYYVMEISTGGVITRNQYTSDGTLKNAGNVSPPTITGTGWFQNFTAHWTGETVKVTNIPLVDEKATITNVPLQTQFEETDTRKIYSRLYTSAIGGLDWVEMGTAGFLSSTGWCNGVTMTHVNAVKNTAQNIFGNEIESSHTLIGEVVTSISFYLMTTDNTGGNTDTYQFGIWDSAGNEKTISSAQNVKDLQYDTDPPTVKKTLSVSAHTIAVGDVIGVYQGSTNSYCHIGTSAYNDPASNESSRKRNSSNVWSDEQSGKMGYTMCVNE